MTPRSSVRHLVIAATLAVLGLGPGCDQTKEIPLAKVPPPPADFGKPFRQANTYKGASPSRTGQ